MKKINLGIVFALGILGVTNIHTNNKGTSQELPLSLIEELPRVILTRDIVRHTIDEASTIEEAKEAIESLAATDKNIKSLLEEDKAFIVQLINAKKAQEDLINYVEGIHVEKNLDEQILGDLIKNGADINKEIRHGLHKDRGLTPLLLAITFDFGDKGDILKLLVDAGADIEKGVITPLMYALRTHNFKTAKYLLDKGANVNTKNLEGMTPLMYAVKAQDPVAMDLINAGAEINVQDKNGKTPLMYAVERDNPVAMDLINAGAEINVKDKNGETPLMYAVQRGKRLAIDLINKGADINAQNTFGITVFMYAARGGNRDIVHLLKLKGVDINAQDKAGETALDYALAQEKDEQNIVGYLRFAGARTGKELSGK